MEKEPAEVVQASDRDASLAPPLATNWEETPLQMSTHQRDYLSQLAWERLGIP